MSVSESIKPISLWKSLLLFAATSALIFVGVYYGIPALQSQRLSFLAAYLICFYTPFVLIFLIALVVYWMEGNDLTRAAFAARYRLRGMDGKTWLWTVGLVVFCLLVFVGLSFTGKWLATIPLFAPPEFFPAEINPTKEMVAGVFMDTPLKGNWWIVLAYLVGWFFNIVGEELLWRGYLLPRQELAYGRHAWLVHGILWALWHVFWKWNLLAILPVALAIPFVVQRTRNTWVGIIAHGTANFIPLIVIVIGVVG
jgi:membrane protease YdiL (CAAX protease family)